ncbi:MAG: HAMP domain-containing histidine kinase [Acidimicrobiia bacterium]|nr:HAMP domain-containing histidine kinase [Acidimicrobiia bacterium]
MQWVLWLHVLGLPAVGLINGESIVHVVPDSAGLLVLALMAHFLRHRVVQATLVASGLLASSGLLVHFTDGLIESHFHFFVMIPLVALYQDWRPFLLSVWFVVLHHAVLGVIDPAGVYNHAAAQARPILWAVVHAVYVLGVVAVMIVHWAFSERAQAEAADHRRLLEKADRRMRESERKRLSDLIRAKDQFIASVSHELRTPLSVVLGLALELRDSGDLFTDQEHRELTGLIADQAVEVSAIVEDLLVAARAEIEQLTLLPATLDLRDEVRRVIEHLVTDAERVALVPGGVVHAVGDPIRVRQVIRNLVKNAIRHGGPNIRIHLSHSDGGAVIEVRDDGPEIPEEQRTVMFEPYATRGSINQGVDSVGLGLTISRTLACLMQGDLEYDHTSSESVFRFFLPVPDASDHVAGPAVSKTTTNDPRRWVGFEGPIVPSAR